jgi:hypothetical protein
MPNALLQIFPKGKFDADRAKCGKKNAEKIKGGNL